VDIAEQDFDTYIYIYIHNIWDVILPIDFHIFQRGSNHQPVAGDYQSSGESP
jgi:hypothetical protein